MKRIIGVLLIVFTLFSGVYVVSYADTDSTTNVGTEIVVDESATDLVSPMSDVIKWRYKLINGKMKKRLYNYTKQIWVGNWIDA